MEIRRWELNHVLQTTKALDTQVGLRDWNMVFITGRPSGRGLKLAMQKVIYIGIYHICVIYAYKTSYILAGKISKCF